MQNNLVYHNVLYVLCYINPPVTLTRWLLWSYCVYEEVEFQHLIKFAVQCAKGAVNYVSRRIRLSNAFLVGTQIVKPSVKSNRYAVNTLIYLKGRTRESVSFIFSFSIACNSHYSLTLITTELYGVSWKFNGTKIWINVLNDFLLIIFLLKFIFVNK